MRLFMLSLICLFAGILSAQITVGPQPPAGEPGKFYSHQFQGAGGSGPYLYSVNSPYSTPTGLVLNQNTGVLSGTLQPPVTGDSYTFAVTATDITNQQGSTLMTLTMKSASDKSANSSSGCAASNNAGNWNLAVALAAMLGLLGLVRLTLHTK